MLPPRVHEEDISDDFSGNIGNSNQSGNAMNYNSYRHNVYINNSNSKNNNDTTTKLINNQKVTKIVN
jgi:hypothetical protein